MLICQEVIQYKSLLQLKKKQIIIWFPHLSNLSFYLNIKLHKGLKQFLDNIMFSRFLKIRKLKFIKIVRWFRRLLIFLTFANIIIYCLYDLSYRLDGIKEHTILRNEILYYFELIFNCFFLVEIILHSIKDGIFIGKGSYLRNFWNILNFIVTISSFLAYIPDKITSDVFKTIRIFRVLRIIQLFPSKIM